MEGTMQSILKFATTYLTPTMIVVFGAAIFLRFMIYWTVKREDWFAREFERRTHTFMEELPQDGEYSFFLTVKLLLEKTFYEIFIMRSIMKRRGHDVVMNLGDRAFLIQQGSAFLVKDILKQIKYLKHGTHAPKMLELTKSVCQNNPCFNRIFGIIPLGVNDIMNVLPGMFVIGGIFGTFLGIMDGLHSLAEIDISDVDGTQATMNAFLSHVAFSMSTSIVGIILSVIMTMFNTLLNPEKLFLDIVERFENSFDILWNRSNSNTLPENIESFDQHRDPMEALAESSVNKELKHSRFRDQAEQALRSKAREKAKESELDESSQCGLAESIIEGETSGAPKEEDDKKEKVA